MKHENVSSKDKECIRHEGDTENLSKLEVSLSETKLKDPRNSSRNLSNSADSCANIDQQRIAELTNLMDMQGNQLELLTVRAQSLVWENKQLREANAKAIQSSSVSEINTKSVDIEKKEKRLLYNQCQVLGKELERANEYIAERDESIANLSKTSAEMSNKIQVLEREYQLLNAQKQDYEKEFIRVTQYTSTNKAKTDDILMSLKNARFQNRQLEAQLKDNRETVIALEKEASQATAQLTQIIADRRDLFEKYSSTRLILEELQSRWKQASDQFSYMEKKNSKARNRVHELEQEIKHLRQTLDKKKEAMKNNNVVVENLTIERDKLTSNKSFLEQNIHRLVEEHKVYSSNLIKSTQETVEELRSEFKHQMNLKSGQIDQYSTLQLKINQLENKLKNEIHSKEILSLAFAERRHNFSDAIAKATKAEERNIEIMQSHKKLEFEQSKCKSELAELIIAKDAADNQLRKERDVFNVDSHNLREHARSMTVKAKSLEFELASLKRDLDEDRVPNDETVLKKFEERGRIIDELKIEIDELSQKLGDKNRALQESVEDFKLSLDRKMKEKEELRVRFEQTLQNVHKMNKVRCQFVLFRSLRFPKNKPPFQQLIVQCKSLREELVEAKKERYSIENDLKVERQSSRIKSCDLAQAKHRITELCIQLDNDVNSQLQIEELHE